MYSIPFILLIVTIIWFIYRKQWQNLVRPLEYRAHYSGSPRYIAGSTSGSPLSDLGSHCGFKSVPEREEPCSTAVYATTASFGAGRICDFSITLHEEKGQRVFSKRLRRTVHFNPYVIEEKASAEKVTLYSRLFFLQYNLALFEIEWVAKSDISIFPALSLFSTSGRDVENPYPHLNGFTFFKKQAGGIGLKNFYRVPGQKLRLFFLPSSGGATGKKVIQGLPVKLKAGEKSRWSVVLSFSADSDRLPVERAERALRNLRRLKDGAAKRINRFERSLSLERITDQDSSRETFRLAAWALQNSLYHPRGKMSRRGSVPAKVYFPFFWGWDTPQAARSRSIFPGAVKATGLNRAYITC